MHGLVTEIQWRTPTLVSITFGGDGLAEFEPSPSPDSYVNVAIPPPDAPYTAPFDLDELKSLDRRLRPFRRRYTVRHWSPIRRKLTLDFVVHGARGIGGPWAANARMGDALVLTGPAGSYRPDDTADWHLLVGDESAVPAIAAVLESLPSGTSAVVRLLCDGPAHEFDLAPGRAPDIAWLQRTGGALDEELLVNSVRDLDFPRGRAAAFVHGEAAETRAVRRHLLADRELSVDQLSCSPYWRRGFDDEAWRQVKAAWNADVARDVPGVLS
jgi:NADPH-dependent ferric siderophore reductase